MADKIRVLIVDDSPETRENVRKLLQFEADIDVVGQAGTGEQAIKMAKELQPDIILMDINMPGIDGLAATQQISDLVPRAQVIIMSVQSDSDYLRRAMTAGARDFLTKPFSGDKLILSVQQVYKKRPTIAATPVVTGNRTAATAGAAPTTQDGKIISVYSPKGGVGCTTIAVNLAVGLARRERSTLLVDCSLQFGDVSVMLNQKAVTSITDLVDRGGELDGDLINSVVQLHRSGLSVLLAPSRPEEAERITEAKVENLLNFLKQMYEFIIIDTSSWLNGVVLSILDTSQRIVLVTEQSLPSLKNASRFFDLSESLEYQPQKVWLVVNRASNKQGISLKDVSNALKRPVVVAIPEDEVSARMAANQGVPIVSGNNSRQPVGVALTNLSNQIIQELGDDDPAESLVSSEPVKESGLLGRLFSSGRGG